MHFVKNDCVAQIREILKNYDTDVVVHTSINMHTIEQYLDREILVNLNLHNDIMRSNSIL